MSHHRRNTAGIIMFSRKHGSIKNRANKIIRVQLKLLVWQLILSVPTATGLFKKKKSIIPHKALTEWANESRRHWLVFISLLRLYCENLLFSSVPTQRTIIIIQPKMNKNGWKIKVKNLCLILFNRIIRILNSHNPKTKLLSSANIFY